MSNPATLRHHSRLVSSATVLAILAVTFLLSSRDSPFQWRQRFLAGNLMAGTPFVTPYYVIGDGHGPTVLVLGGVHGDEPGAWKAAQSLVRSPPRFDGTIVVVPQANRLADLAGIRSKPEWGDLNRLYPGSAGGLPMSAMALDIEQLIQKYRVDGVIDLHESWDYLANMPTQPPGGVDTAFLGQTISADDSAGSSAVARAAVAIANSGISGKDRFTYFE
ncbi:MAG TPA: succinylglutamate desuccinylase/aspartoacylase family protein, partial [Dehalococcoidia bacterium]